MTSVALNEPIPAAPESSRPETRTPILLNNSLSRQIETFVPSNPDRVTMYVCGPTVYATPHLGNARPAVVFDVLFRLLRARHPVVVYARNLTDIDDKIIEAAARNGEPIGVLTARTISEYQGILGVLGCLEPSVEPRATESIDAIRTMINKLIMRGHAYVADGHVLFSLASHPGAGRLSGHEPDALRAGHRVAVASYKRADGDFVLWKPSDDTQPGWDSPWGRGRPGWHIECSAMIHEHLGTTIDIHGGGQDLRFPHHDCEIAQSECANHAPLARFFLHNGLLNVGGGKMAKSAGNVVSVADLLDEGFDGEAIRLGLLITHYTQPIECLDVRDPITTATEMLDKWRNAMRPHHEVETPVLFDGMVERALCQDIGTPGAIAAMHRQARLLTTSRNDAEIAAAMREMRTGASLLGILRDQLEPPAPLPLAFREILDQRDAARKAKDFDRSDTLRAVLAGHGIAVQDEPDRTLWWWSR